MIQALFRISGWLALAFIAFATLSPINERPSVAGPPLEHFVAYAVVGLAFMLGYPRRLQLMVAIVITSAFALEALQLLTPDRHARMLDALVKAAGGLCGITAGRLMPVFLQDWIDRFKKLPGRSPS
ncbi:VanZ family protein [Bradyrhizobium lablabi]|uniref:VanZ family protein n=1 Tax=Bradyrhizobium lablabi TaxID=722472 RepID=UPI001BA56733|nr:VanZ family protein [Bradyrhizobium lablabi]MBR0694951.1 VanZ family protein [Bradyrhizobium lablabi]